MFERERQVVMTYITWRWMWLIAPLFCLMSILPLLGGGDSACSGLGMPILMGFIWLVVVGKWQFVNPRARLIPGFAEPHLMVLAIPLALALIINPLLVAAAGGFSPLGPLAYTLLLGGLCLWGVQTNHSSCWLAGTVVFLSGMTEVGRGFWFQNQQLYLLIHLVMALAGLSLVVGWLWRLANLHEEQDDYQIIALGSLGQVSRLERAEQRRMVGRRLKQSGLFSWISDRWHDQLRRPSQKTLSRVRLYLYGFGSLPTGLKESCFCIGFIAYGNFLYRLSFLSRSKSADLVNHPPMILVVFALIIPAGIAGMLLFQHRARMAQELLRPTSRIRYINDLFFTLANRTISMWFAMLFAIIVVGITLDQYDKVTPVQTTIAFAVLSLALQVPAFGISLRLAKSASMILCLLGMYVVIGFQWLALWSWWELREQYGDLLVLAPLTFFLLTLGGAAVAWARRSWLSTEFG